MAFCKKIVMVVFLTSTLLGQFITFSEWKKTNEAAVAVQGMCSVPSMLETMVPPLREVIELLERNLPKASKHKAPRIAFKYLEHKWSYNKATCSCNEATEKAHIFLAEKLAANEVCDVLEEKEERQKPEGTATADLIPPSLDRATPSSVLPGRDTNPMPAPDENGPPDLSDKPVRTTPEQGKVVVEEGKVRKLVKLGELRRKDRHMICYLLRFCMLVVLLYTCAMLWNTGRVARKEVDALRDEHRRELEQMRIQNRQELAELRTEYRKGLEELRTEHRKDVEEMCAQHRQDLGELCARVVRLEDLLSAAPTTSSTTT
jgi:hypothetical protein